MDFTFSADQDDLRAGVRTVVAGQPRGDEPGAADAAWATAVALGWPALLVPVANGGLGLGLVDAVVVLEELGRGVSPAPFLSSAVSATIAARRLGLDHLLDDLAAGRRRGTVALDELGHGDPVDRVRARARRRGGAWHLQGLKPVVLDGVGADWVLVAARTQDGLSSFLVEGATLTEVPIIDPTRRVGRLDLATVTAERVGPIGDHTGIWRRVADDTAVGLAAELVGVGDAALAASIAYAKDRVQFDVPIASHQVVQHKLVDMLHRLELGRVGVHHAAWASDVDDAHRQRSASIAKAAMAEAAVMVTSETIQIHGAVGFTWEALPHLFYKRAKANDVLAGYQGWHRRRVADAVLTPA